MKFRVSKPKLPKPEQGFTMVEVLIAILIATIFVAVTMQMMALAAMFKVRAQEYAEATAWIQEDLESVKYEAASFQYTSLTANAVANAAGASSDITVASADSFAVNDNLKVGSDSNTYTISAKSGNTLTITPGLKSTQPQDAAVVATTRCKSSILTKDISSGATAIDVASVGNFANNDTLTIGTDTTRTYTISSINATQSQLNINTGLSLNEQGGTVVVITSPNAGFADGLQDWISDTDHTNGITNIDTTDSNAFVNPPNSGNFQTSGDPLRSKLFKNKTFRLKRTTKIRFNPASPASDAPYKVLEINYEVSPIISGETVGAPIASFNTEVIPNAALQCPN